MAESVDQSLPIAQIVTKLGLMQLPPRRRRPGTRLRQRISTKMRQAVALLTLALTAGISTAYAGTDLEDFDSGANPSGWTWGTSTMVSPNGGNPNGHLRTPVVDTFAPQLRTTVPSSPFHGDYRAGSVSNIHVDLAVFSANFPYDREATLMLSNGNCSVYKLGAQKIPPPNGTWKSFDYAIDPHSPTMPTGWKSFGNCQGGPNAIWNTVITNVTEVRIFYGDPDLFYIFDQFSLGLDNASITRDSFTDLGNGLAGTNGIPTLSASGALTAGSPVSIQLGNALGSTSAFLMVGLAPINASLLGGTLVPDVAGPGGLVIPLPIPASGSLSLNTNWPAGMPPNTSVYLQYWIADPGAVFGASASNAIVGTTP